MTGCRFRVFTESFSEILGGVLHSLPKSCERGLTRRVSL